jgi:hypothetical protein
VGPTVIVAAETNLIWYKEDATNNKQMINASFLGSKIDWLFRGSSEREMFVLWFDIHIFLLYLFFVR